MRDKSNLRLSPRYQIGLPVFCKVTPKGAQAPIAGSGWTRNLSTTGACLELTEALTSGTSLSLVLETEEGSLALDAEVVWVAHPSLPGGHTLHGISFPQITPDQRQALEALLRRKGPVRSHTNRIPTALPVQCRLIGVGETHMRGWTGDLSQEGCSLLLPDRLPVGTLIELMLTTPRGDFTVQATVVWAEPTARVPTRQFRRHGARFTTPNVIRDVIIDFALEADLTGPGQEFQASP